MFVKHVSQWVQIVQNFCTQDCLDILKVNCSNVPFGLQNNNNIILLCISLKSSRNIFYTCSNIKLCKSFRNKQTPGHFYKRKKTCMDGNFWVKKKTCLGKTRCMGILYHHHCCSYSYHQYNYYSSSSGSSLVCDYNTTWRWSLLWYNDVSSCKRFVTLQRIVLPSFAWDYSPLASHEITAH